MPVNRRMILASGGAAAAVTLMGGWAILANPPLSRASAPWEAAGKGLGDPRLDALSFAILAPNPHNRQPWQFSLAGIDRIDIHCDLARRLPATDPLDRQITIGFGCMIELLRMACAEQGYTARIEAFPDGEGARRLDTRRIASVWLEPVAAQKDPLFAQALLRRSTKEAFEDRAVPQAQIDRLARQVEAPCRFGATQDAEQHRAIADNAWRAWQIEQETPATRRESIDLMRFGNAAIIAQPDGIDMGGTYLSAAHAAGFLTPEELDRPGSTAYQSGFDLYRGMVESTPRWIWLTTATDTRIDQLAAGRSWVRLNLAAQARGLAVHPWSHALQEFPEMAGPYRELRERLAPEGGTVQMFARLGYGPKVPPSPRWPLESKLIDAAPPARPTG